MSAARELAERESSVEVFERNPDYVGGKARSVNVLGTNTQFENKYLPERNCLQGFRPYPQIRIKPGDPRIFSSDQLMLCFVGSDDLKR